MNDFLGRVTEIFNQARLWVIIAIISVLVLSIALTVIRWRFRVLFSRSVKTFRLSFGFLSKDLPLRSEQLFIVLYNIIRLPLYKRIFIGQPFLVFSFRCFGKHRALYVSIPDFYNWPESVVSVIHDKLSGCQLIAVDETLFPIIGSRKYGLLRLLYHSAFPLRTIKGFESDDPTEHLWNALEANTDNGLAAVSIRIKPCSRYWKRRGFAIREYIRAKDDPSPIHARWNTGFIGIFPSLYHEAMSLLSTSSSSTEKKADKRNELSDYSKNVIKSIDDKLSSQACFRFSAIVVLDYPGSSSSHVRNLGAAFSQYDKQDQKLITKPVIRPKARILDTLITNNFWPIFGTRDILSAAELAGIIHNPYGNTNIPNLQTTTSRNYSASFMLTSPGIDKIDLGYNDYRGRSDIVSISFKNLLRHSALVGATGSGKSTLLKSIVLQCIFQGGPDKPCGALILDPHGDMAEEIVAILPKSELERVYYIEPNLLVDHSLAFNPFAGIPGMTYDEVRETVLSGFHAAWEIDPTMASFLLYAQRSFDILVRYPKAHLGYLLPFFTNQAFRDHVLDTVADQEATYFWRSFYGSKTKRHQEEDTRSLISRVNQFIIDRRTRNIFCQSQTKINFSEIMDQGRIVIASFTNANLGATSKRLLGNFFSSYIHQACRKRSPERRPFIFLIDEAEEYLTRALAEVLSQDRKFGLSLNLSFQYCEQVRSILPSIIGNVQTWIAFRLGEIDARYLAPIFSSSSEEEEISRRLDDLMNLENYRAFIKTNIEGVPQQAASFRLFEPDQDFHLENIEIALENTRRDLCRNYNEIKEEQSGLIRLWHEGLESEEGPIQF